MGFLLLAGCIRDDTTQPPTTLTPSSAPLATGTPLASMAPAPTTPAGTASLLPSDGQALATPYSTEPVAGICAGPLQGELASVEIYPDLPSPRCLKVTAQQRLQISNLTDQSLQITLGFHEFTLQPGAAQVINQALGDYLAPGVHLLQAVPFSGPELWLEMP